MSFVRQDHGIVTDCETSFTDTDGKERRINGIVYGKIC